MNTSKQIGENLKKARKDINKTQREIAEILHMTQQQYSRFENGVFELNYEQIIQLCKLFNITPNDLFSTSENNFI